MTDFLKLLLFCTNLNGKKKLNYFELFTGGCFSKFQSIHEGEQG